MTSSTKTKKRRSSRAGAGRSTTAKRAGKGRAAGISPASSITNYTTGLKWLYTHVDNERLQLRYLVRKAYQRSASSGRIARALGQESSGVPLYMYRKLLSYASRLVFQWRAERRRFYLLRLAASLGEVRGRIGRAPMVGDGQPRAESGGSSATGGDEGGAGRHPEGGRHG